MKISGKRSKTYEPTLSSPSILSLMVMLLPLFFAVLSFFLFIFLADYREPCDHMDNYCFCENNPNNQSVVHQPINTASCIFYVFFGTVTGIHAFFAVDKYSRQADLIFIPALISLIGYMSIFYHAFTTSWASVLDGLGMYLTASYLFGVVVARLFIQNKTKAQVIGFIFIFVQLMVITLVGFNDLKTYMFAAYIGLTLVLEIYNFTQMKGWFRCCNCFNYHTLKLDKTTNPCFLSLTWYEWYLPIGVLSFLIGLVFWSTELDLCVPNSAFQFHALWHFFTALGFAFLYFYIFETNPFFP